MTLSSTSITIPNSPANPSPLRSTPPETPSQPHSIDHCITGLATLVFQSPAAPGTWGISTPDPESPLSWTFPNTRNTSMESGGNGDEQGKDKGKSRQSSPSTASSQGDMADNEGEGSSSQVGEQTGAPPPPKKKRTRTLTTPHQAAVLHALLAQSRFPTTAMREEVGRAIGLSARKVQIWFQNQRQKARRPKGQNVPPLTRPPQYGPFPSIPSGSTIGEPSLAAGTSSEGVMGTHTGGDLQRHGASRSAPAGGAPDTFGFRETLDSEGISRAQGFAPQLSGPGIPGSPPTTPRSPRSIRSAPYARHHPPPVAGSSAFRPEGLPMHRAGHSFAFSYPLSRTRPFTADDSSRSLRTLTRPGSPPVRNPVDFDVRLPPLMLPRARSRTHGSLDFGEGASSASRQFAAMREPDPELALPPIAGPSRPRTAESPFAFNPSLRIPPPFTLQPRPQWDDASFSPFSRLRSQSHSPPFAFPQMPYESLALPRPPLGPPHPQRHLEQQPGDLTLPPPHTYTIPPHERAADDRPSLVPVQRLQPRAGSPHPPPSRRDDDDEEEESHEHGVAH